MSTYTVTIGGASTFAGVGILCVSGGLASSSYDSTAGTDNANNNSGSATSIQVSTNFTPTNANEILVSFLGWGTNSAVPTIDSSFSAVTYIDDVAGISLGLGVSWQIQTTATARQPTWSLTSGNFVAVTLAAFQSAAVSGSTPTLLTMGVGK